HLRPGREPGPAARPGGQLGDAAFGARGLRPPLGGPGRSRGGRPARPALGRPCPRRRRASLRRGGPPAVLRPVAEPPAPLRRVDRAGHADHPTVTGMLAKLNAGARFFLSAETWRVALGEARRGPRYIGEPPAVELLDEDAGAGLRRVAIGGHHYWL